MNSSNSSNIPSNSFVCDNVTGDAMKLEMALTDERASRTEATTAQDARLPALFDAHHERLYRLARRLSPTAEEARDLVQETFLRVVRSPGSIPTGASSEEAWLVRILINLCRDEWRKNASQKRFGARYLPEVRTVDATNTEGALIARTAIWRALESLPPRRRAAVILYELEGVDFQKIAQLLGVSAITARWHVSRGRQELARIITEQERGTS